MPVAAGDGCEEGARVRKRVQEWLEGWALWIVRRYGEQYTRVREVKCPSCGYRCQSTARIEVRR
jgi:hypothetical protein